MKDRSSRPRSCPHQLPRRVERRIIALRVSRRWGPARIGYRLRLNPATVHRVLARYRCVPLRCVDPATGTRIRGAGRRPIRYEHAAPGDLIHDDVKKLGRIPDGGGHRVLGRSAGWRHKRVGNPNAKPGYSFIHHALADHSRLAYSEIHRDERKETAAAFWAWANAYFTSCGVGVRRVLTDNGNAYRYCYGGKRSARRSPTSEPGPTGRRPTARSNASTALCSRNGPTPAPTPARTSASPPSPSCCTPTITTAATPRSQALHSRPRPQPGGAEHLGRRAGRAHGSTGRARGRSGTRRTGGTRCRVRLAPRRRGEGAVRTPGPGRPAPRCGWRWRAHGPS